jgi:hypothetical protein
MGSVDLLPPAPATDKEPVLAERSVRLSTSALWRLQRTYFERARGYREKAIRYCERS